MNVGFCYRFAFSFFFIVDDATRHYYMHCLPMTRIVIISFFSVSQKFVARNNQILSSTITNKINKENEYRATEKIY